MVKRVTTTSGKKKKQKLINVSLKSLAGAKGFWFALVFAGFGSYFWYSSYAATGWQLVWQDTFGAATLSSTDWQIYQGPENHSQAVYTANNVSTQNDYAVLKTRRHCITTPSEPLTSANDTSNPCPAGTATKYSSGQIRSLYRWKSGRIEIRARLPRAQKGQWPALWMRNQSDWCNLNYGELDIVEWYYDTKISGTMKQTLGRNNATSHATCELADGTSGVTKMVKHYEDYDTDLTASFHTFAVEWDATAVVYEMDGKRLRYENRATSPDGDAYKTTKDDFPVTAPRFSAIMNQSWELRAQTQIIKPGDAYHSAPDNTKPFYSYTMLIDSVKIFQK